MNTLTKDCVSKTMIATSSAHNADIKTAHKINSGHTKSVHRKDEYSISERENMTADS